MNLRVTVETEDGETLFVGFAGHHYPDTMWNIQHSFDRSTVCSIRAVAAIEALSQTPQVDV